MADLLLDELNESQRAAVVYTEGPSLVVAGAGSGKTRVLTYKIAYLLNQGYEPWSVLALTFTNKAAREMKERIARQVGPDRARYLWMGTFHSVFLRILRAEAALTGFKPDFTIYDSADSKNLLKSIIKEMKLDDKVYKPAVVQGRISNAKNRLILPETYRRNDGQLEADRESKVPLTGEIYERYWERCRQAGAMDFDDLLLQTYLLFVRHPEVCDKYASRFRYVLVDEYQDTNFAQHSIVMQLTRKYRRVCVVGDDAQSIYSFRGADVDNILHFTKLYKDAKLFKLERNYRSTQNIVDAANSLIAKNRHQIRKEVFSEREKGDRIGIYSAYSDMEEGEIVAGKMIRMHAAGYGYNDFAILYRTNAQSRVLEETLRKRGVPYRVYGGLSFYQRKEVKDVIAYFRLLANPDDEEAFKRVVNYPARGIGDATVGKLVTAASEAGVSLWKVLEKPLAFGLNVNKNIGTKLQNFRLLIEQLRTFAAGKEAYEVGQEVVKKTGIMADLMQDRSPEGLGRQENVEEMMNAMYDFCTSRREEADAGVSLSDFLSEVSLLTDQDETETEGTEKVTLMTIHASKGLEFKNVFVVGMEENLFPGQLSAGNPRALEEERRLFYVAVTRAGEHCFLSFAKSRLRYGKVEFASPSRFLSDIDPRYVDMPQEELLGSRIGERAERFRQMNPTTGNAEADISREKQNVRRTIAPPRLKRVELSLPDNAESAVTDDVNVGCVIEHERFGRGEVVHVEGNGANRKATVHFANAGTKQLLLKYARFKVIS